MQEILEEKPVYKLNKEQEAARKIIEGTNKNVLLIGYPGVGKSVLINHLVEFCQSKFFHLAAPTGMAALNIPGARTLHSLFRLPVSQGAIAPDYDNFTTDDKVLSMIKYGIKYIIIDEISMVRADMLDFVHRLMQHAKGNNLPFGGAQVIAVGDFFQLPPVTSTAELVQLRQYGYASPFAFDSKVMRENPFEVVQLSTIMRQKGDKRFIQLLHNARVGKLTSSDVRLLNERVNPNVEDLRIRVTCKNKQADAINRDFMNRLAGPDYQFVAKKFGSWPALPVEESLTLRVGAQVMVKKNKADRPPGKWGPFESTVVNGTIGKIVSIHLAARNKAENPEAEEMEDHIVIELDNGQTAKIYTAQWERKIKERNEEGKWEEVVVASYEQMPLTPAWAISIHKSQGQSFDKVHIDLSGVFAPGQSYVALSRARKLDGVTLETPVNMRKFFSDRAVIKFDNEINE